jgi:hypothetical protein
LKEDPTKLQHLGDFILSLPRFSDLEQLFKDFQNEGFRSLGERQKIERIHRLLLRLIDEAKTPCFLLAAVNDFIDRVNKEKLVESYSLSHFEIWLNQFSQLEEKENYVVRAKIMGKYIPREEYQILFPIGMGKVYPGSHYVTAHNSPDLDTTVASFWGWVDAFAARVGDGLHIWNVPGGPPVSQVEVSFLFQNILGDRIFDHIAKTRSSLALSAIDLMTQKGVVKKNIEESMQTIDHERNQSAVILVDELGYYLGDWRNFDVEGVRQVTMLLNNCLRWFGSHFQSLLTSLFSKDTLTRKDISHFIKTVFAIRIKECEPVKEFTTKQKEYIEDYLTKILNVQNGWESTFEEFWHAMKSLYIFEFQEFNDVLESLPSSSLFDSSGVLVENRPKIFNQLEKIVRALEKAILSIRKYVDRLGIALNIKREVFGYIPQVVSYRAEVEEIRSKLGTYPYLTVTVPDLAGKQVALGVIHASDIFRPILGTVSLRDFCNREETKIPSYFEVISVIDHHKSSLVTMAAPMACISDSQSSNALVAEMAFSINDKYGRGGRSLEDVERQTKELNRPANASERRVLQRLLQKHLVLEKKHDYFVDPSREYLEYLQCLYAILDDTDLLSKISYRDVHCLAALLNRLKSLMMKKEIEIIHFDDIKADDQFVSKAAKRILQNHDMYSLYRKIYHSKEQAIEQNLRMCVKGEPCSIFSDTKTQNNCCRVGQTKLFVKNFPFFQSHAHEIRAFWYVDAKKFYEERNEFDLHLHMISTIPGAEDVFAGTEGQYDHKDELWIWIPSTEQAIEHLKSFLNAFRFAPQLVQNEMEVEFIGDNARMLDQIFNESFLPIPRRTSQDKKISVPIAILRYRAGSINSRKAMISPYLPKLMS